MPDDGLELDGEHTCVSGDDDNEDDLLFGLEDVDVVLLMIKTCSPVFTST